MDLQVQDCIGRALLFLSPITYSARERFRELRRPDQENKGAVIARGVPASHYLPNVFLVFLLMSQFFTSYAVIENYYFVTQPRAPYVIY